MMKCSCRPQRVVGLEVEDEAVQHVLGQRPDDDAEHEHADHRRHGEVLAPERQHSRNEITGR